MSGTLLSLLGALLCAALFGTVLRPQRPELALSLCIGAGVLVVVRLASQLLPLVSTLRTMLESGGVSTEYLSFLLKAVGIVLVTQLTADTCRDAGEGALAAKAELVGRVLLLMLSLPLLRQVLALATSLISGQAVDG